MTIVSSVADSAGTSKEVQPVSIVDQNGNIITSFGGSGGSTSITFGTVSADDSTTITAGGTAQTPLNTDSTREGVILGNPHGSETLWYAWNGVTAAPNGQGSLPLFPGQAVTFTAPEAGTAISVYAATTGHPITLSVAH